MSDQRTYVRTVDLFTAQEPPGAGWVEVETTMLAPALRDVLRKTQAELTEARATIKRFCPDCTADQPADAPLKGGTPLKEYIAQEAEKCPIEGHVYGPRKCVLCGATDQTAAGPPGGCKYEPHPAHCTTYPHCLCGTEGPTK